MTHNDWLLAMKGHDADILAYADWLEETWQRRYPCALIRELPTLADSLRWHMKQHLADGWGFYDRLEVRLGWSWNLFNDCDGRDYGGAAGTALAAWFLAEQARDWMCRGRFPAPVAGAVLAWWEKALNCRLSSWGGDGVALFVIPEIP